jgi:predicted DNA-binding transcriptional regulator AlpA
LKNHDSEEPLLNRKQAAKYLNVAVGTLCVWDSTKRYNLEPIKLGKCVRYRRSSLDRFIESQSKIRIKTGKESFLAKLSSP